MLTMNTLQPAPGSRKRHQRLGRGRGSGCGGTSGRGHKGDGSRSGRKQKPYFEGGQTPLTRRIPKRGFDNPFRKQFQIVNIGDLTKISGEVVEIDVNVLYEHGLVHSPVKPVKILGTGEISRAVTIKADAYSEVAREKLKAAKATVR